MSYRGYQYQPVTTLKQATTELEQSLDDESEVKIQKMIQLLQITRTLTSPSHWKGDNSVSDNLIKILRLFLVDRDKTVRTQGARAMKYITYNLSIMNQLTKYNIPFFMSRCLEREDRKYLWERMQSLKWIHHLMTKMDNNTNNSNNINIRNKNKHRNKNVNINLKSEKFKFPRCLAQSIIAIASSTKDEFRSICVDTLRDLVLKDVEVVSQCNGIKIIISCILDTSLGDTNQSLLLTLLYILDHPNTRKYLRESLDVQSLFAPFTEMETKKPPQLNSQQLALLQQQKQQRRSIAIRTLMTMLKSVTGILYIASDNYCLRSLVDLMKLPSNFKEMLWAREAMFSVLEEILAPISDTKLEHARGPNLMVNYAGLILIAFIKNGLIETLVEVGLRHNIGLPERARALLCKIQLLSARYLPKSLCAHISAIPQVINGAAMFSFGMKERMRFGTQLEMTVSRNFATNMLIELSEPVETDDPAYDDMQNNRINNNNNSNNKNGGNNTNNTNNVNGINLNDTMASPTNGSVTTNGRHNKSRTDTMFGNNNNGKMERILSRTICHRLGPSMDLNSTFIRYRYMMERDISTIMFQDKIPYHCHQSGINMISEISDGYGQFSMRSQRNMILESLKEDQNASWNDIKWDKTSVGMYKDFTLWDMDEVWKYLNGPLWHLPNLITSMGKANKFMKRLVQYLKPSRQLFCQLKWSSEFFKHAQCACQVFRLLTSCDEGVEFQYFKELVLEIFNCLKDQLEANLKRRRPQLPYAPMSRSNVKTTLSRVYFVLIGILSESDRGIKFFKQHDMLAFLFPLTRKELTDCNLKSNRLVGPNDYLLKLIAVNLDYTIEENFRMLFSSWIASGSFYLRKCLISHLEVLYRAQMPRFDEWSINVLAVLLKQDTKLALTALKVLEKINLSQGSAKSRSYLVDLINTQPTDSVVGLYGQFLFIKMLSTIEGFKWLKTSGWLNTKRKEWIDTFNRRYTKMLEKALWLSVNNAAIGNEDDTIDEKSDNSNTKIKNKDEIKENQESPINNNNINESIINSEEAIDWLPHHLIHEHKTDEEELYHEYLTHFPWTLKVTVKRPSQQEIVLWTDCFFDYNCFVPAKTGYKFPTSMGPGVHALILDKSGLPKPSHIGKSDAIKITLNIGFNCLNGHKDGLNGLDLNGLYSEKSLVKWFKMSDLIRINDECSIINIGQVTVFFQPANFDDSSNAIRSNSLYRTNSNSSNNKRSSSKSNSSDLKHTCLQRVFWSLKEIQKSHSLVRPLPHFYGELAKTKEGCNYINEIGDLNRFLSQVTNSNNKNLESESANLELRASLWALGMIGSSVTGLNLLNSSNVVELISKMALRCRTLSVRGTCLYVLGLFSRTKKGMKQLSKYGFDFPADNLELDLAVAIPRNLDEFFTIDKIYNFSIANFNENNEIDDDDDNIDINNDDEEYEENVLSWANNDKLNKISVSSPPQLARPVNMKPMDANELLGKPGHSEETVLAHISALCNNVTQKSSGGALHKLRTKKPSVFSNPLLLRECVKLLISYNFKLPARRFILFNLFDMCLLDETTIDIFNHSLNEKILPHKEIRQWRYQHRQMMVERKKAAQRSQRGYGQKTSLKTRHGHNSNSGSNNFTSSKNKNSPRTPKSNNFNNIKQSQQHHQQHQHQQLNNTNINNMNMNMNNGMVQKSRSSTIKSDAAGISPMIKPQMTKNSSGSNNRGSINLNSNNNNANINIPPTKQLPIIQSSSKPTPSPPHTILQMQKQNHHNQNININNNNNLNNLNNINIPPPPQQLSNNNENNDNDDMDDDDMDDDDDDLLIMDGDIETPFGDMPEVPSTLPNNKQLQQHVYGVHGMKGINGHGNHHRHGSLPGNGQITNEIAASPTKNMLGPNPLAMD